MPPSADEQGRVLLALAREAVEAAVLGSESTRDEASRDPEAEGERAGGGGWLDRPGATFVTLKIGASLRGCIGSLYPSRSLRDDVAANARAAALEDPRFPAVSSDELPQVTLEVSLLSPLEPVAAASEAELLERLRPGVDGLFLEEAGHRGTFLPQVWSSLPDPATFLAHLRRKAGLAGDHWSDELRFWRFTVAKWREGGAPS